MTKEELQELSCDLIACAGDAYSHFSQAVSLASEGRFDESGPEMEAGRDAIVKGHRSQLALLQAEGQGEGMELGILAMHAQDHLMNAMSYENTARQLIVVHRRLARLEGALR